MVVVERVFEWLVELWLRNHVPYKLGEKIDVIAPLSYGAVEHEIHDGYSTPEAPDIILGQMGYLSAGHPEALVVYGTVKNGVDPAKEHKQKEMAFGEKGIYAGVVKNKIEEAQKFRKAVVLALGREPQTILVVSGEIHGGRGTGYLFRKEFPSSIIMDSFVPWESEIGPTHGFLSSNRWVWLAVNVGWYLVLRLPFGIGYKILNKIEGVQHHPGE